MINQYQKSLLLIFLLFSTILLGKNKKTLIEAQDDTYTVTYSTENQLVGNVYDNDRYGTATPTDKEVYFSYVRRSTDNNGKYISTTRGGMLRLPAGLAVGHHYVYYKIRDIKDVTNFATATATVIVLPQTTTPTTSTSTTTPTTETPTTSTSTTTPTTTTSTTITLTAQDDTYTVTYSTESQLVGSVYDNDRYGTGTPTDKEVQFSYVRRNTDNNEKFISTAQGGMLRLPAGLSVGHHYVYYKIRDIKDATLFATATATVIVLPQTTTPTTSTSTTTTTSTTITLTAQDDTYTVTYSTESQLVGSVYDNDHYGTATPTDKEVQFSYIHRSTDNNGKYISTVRGGMLRLPAGLSVGRHYVYYKIRDIKDATHFATATATATVIVLPKTTTSTTSTATTTHTTSTLTAQDDTYTVTYSTESQLVGSVYDNDHYGTATPTDKEVQFSYIHRSTDNNGKYISTTGGGMLRLPAGLSVGRHYVYYKIRDIKDATHFATATATVIVLPQTTTPTTETPTTSTSTTTTSTTITLTAQDDTYTITYSTEPQLVGSVYDNDRYGTATPTDKEVHFSYVRRSTDDNGKYISTAQGGMLRLPAGLAVGRHYVYYKIRDIKDITHFATATATVIVLPQTTTPTTSTSTTTPTTETPTTSTLTAQDDTYTVTYSTESQLVGSVYDNDRYGTATPTDKEVQFNYVRRSTDDNGKYISTTQGGMLHLPADLAVGRHYVHYKIRDIKDATHSATATATVIVLPKATTPTTSTATTTPTTTTLTAQDDTYTVTYSTESQLVGSVYDNDHYGTQTPTDKDVQFSYVRRSTDNNGKFISTIRGGMLSLPAGLAVGRHYVYYKIRDIKDATHSATATATVIVLLQTTTPTTETPTTSTATTTPTTTTSTTITLTAQDDTYTVTYSAESQLVGSVYDNDHYGTATPTDKEVHFSYVRRSTDNNGKYISTTRGGMLRLPAALSVGHHYVYYKIRDIKDITHFATATATVIVLPQTTTPTTETPTTSTATTTPTTTTLTAQDDTYTVTYSIDPQLVGSVYDNDRYGTATPTDKEVQFLKLSSSVDNNGKYISTTRGGMLHLPAALSVGHHYVYYKIRDIKNTINFATATATVIVLPQTTTPTTETPTTSTATTTPTTTTSTTITLTAQDDTYTVTYSTDPQIVGSVYDNDRYGTATPTDKEVLFSYVRRSTDNNGKYISTIRGGMLHLPMGLAVGRHYVYYKIRDIKDVTHSATATATVIVLPQTTTPTTSTATTTPTTTKSTTITLTAQDDTYTVTYSTEPQLVGSVYDNDRYGTATPTDKEVRFSYIHRSTDDNGKYISTIRGGMLRLPAGLSVGCHYIYYKIRDIKDVTNFATATATVIVLPETTTPTTSTSTTPTTTTSTTITLTAQDDTYTVTYNNEPQTVGSVYDNDHYGTATPTDKEVQFSYVRRSTDNNGKYISTVRGGMLRLPAGLAVGRHYVYYKIRDIKDITHFATATATVIVLPQTTTPTTETPTTSTATTTPTTTTLTAQDDTYTITYSTESQLVGSVYDNDRYGTATPTDKEVQFSYVRRSTDNNGKYISTIRGGMLLLPAGLAVGRHYVYYKIRDIKDATHFATATATVIVLPQTTTPTTETPTTSTATTTPTTTTLTAQDDTYTVTYSTEPQIVGSVYDNDRYGTATPTDKEVQFSYIHRSTDNNGKYISTIRDGMLRLPAGLSVGRHYVYYKIRDIKDITNFATATATVIVLPQTTTPTTSTATTTPTTTTLTAQDDIYTVTYSTESQLVGSVYDNDHYGTQTPTDKEVHFSYVRRSTDNNGKYISTIRGGMLRLPAGLAVGRHYIYYKIRDIKDITHSATATATVVVLPQTTTPTTSPATTTPTTTTSTTITLTAQDDTYTVTYSADPQTIGSVYDNDRYGTATPTDKEVQFSYVRRSTDDNGKYISTTRGGMLRLPAGLSVGHHYVYYKIRDIKDATHFATATATVIVLPQTTTPTTETPTTSTSTTTNTTITLTAQDDTYTVTYSTESQLVGSVYDNDRYGTATPTDKEVQFSYIHRSTDDNGKYISTTRGGMLRLPAALSVGRHYVYYKIRDIKDVTHFATATATVIVLPQTTTPTTETPTTSTATTTPTTSTSTTTTSTTTSTTTTLTAQDDTYTVTYSTESQMVGSVYDNDRYGTATPTDKEVHFSYVRRSTDNNGKFISTAQGGMLRLPAGLAVGRHYVYYKIRDIKDITHFATATATVIVLPQTTTPTTSTSTTTTSTTTATTASSTTITNTTIPLTAQDDTYTVTYSTESQLVGSVYDNDRYGTATPTDKEVQFSYVRRSTDDNGKYISTAQGGMLRLPAGLSVGRHYVYYKIRDIKDATHFATATATVIVLPQTTTPTTETPTTSTATTTPTTTTLTAQDDTYTVTYSNEPQTVGSVYDNDRYGTATPTDKEVQFLKLSSSVDNNGKFISTAQGGMLRLPAGLAEGRHYVHYKIRDIKDVTHFATATATVIVLPTTETPTTSTSTTTPTTTTSTTITLTAQDDTYTVTYNAESQTVGSVYDNDRYGTQTPTDKEVQFSYVRRSTNDNGKYISTIRGGMLRLPAGLDVGRHYVYYKIRDIKDATHFATATATVIVLPQTTTPTTETPTTEEPLRPIAVADAVTTPMNTPVLIAILQNDIPYDAVPYISAFPYKGSVTLNDSNEVLYTPNSNTTGADSFTYELRSPDAAISLVTTTVTVKIWSPITPCTGISANGDGKNDYFHIMGIENYPENTLTIYDSNANEVFSVSHYDNEVCRFEGADLPQGVYFFVLTYRDEDDNLEQQVGWFYLKK